MAAKDRKLLSQVQTCLPGEAVLAAIVMNTGPPPGAVSGPHAWFGAPVGQLLAALTEGTAIGGERQHFTLAVTSSGLALVENSSSQRPKLVLRRCDGHGALTDVDDKSGDFSVTLDGQRYWVDGSWAYQLYRVRHLLR